MDVTLFRNISILLAFAIAVLLICYRFKIPEIIGFLLTGIMAGPYGLGIFTNMQEIDFLAEIGVVLLLFTIGIEFSFKNLIELKKQFFVGGTLQVLLTFAATFLITMALGVSLNTAIMAGFLVSLSSTAIVLRLLQEKDEMDTPHGRIIVGILIFQDIVSVLMMLLIPFLSGSSSTLLQSIPLLLVEVVGLVVLVIVGTVWLVPKVLYRVARTRSQELFMLSVVVLLLAMAWLTSSIGLSLALGAFLAGLIISESQYSTQALGGILPFRYVFTSFFFVSIGMLLDVQFVLDNPAVILLAVVAVLVVKAILAGGTAIALGYQMRTAVLTGFALSQVGEFSFILSKLGVDTGLLSQDMYQFFLATSILTMALSPFLINFSPRVSDVICKLPLPQRFIENSCDIRSAKMTANDHLVIIGYGLNGRNLARAAKAASVPYVIIEMNPDTVAVEKEKGEPIHYGDATNEKVLEHANVPYARVAVIAISDANATRRITAAVREMSPKVHIIVRTRYLKEMGPLYDMGANEVVPEEFETSLEIFARVLKKYLVPRESVDTMTAELRSESYEALRKRPNGYVLSDLDTPAWNVEVSTIQVKEGAAASGKTIKDVELRKKYGVTVLLLKRGAETIYNPDADTRLMPGDWLFVFGEPAKLSGASALFGRPA
ncbi:putative Na(+)/H(+) antiporter [Methanocella paludicola SANAE]|uniref:Na(+)/H(+) antiporter n=1 Tax=Methanocella paludicola (strain DSM 17711 / JCM 13418 / NBRC 101707 / SANAE) TaxID=304371 RepID=D1Z218_METPS|nr:monovalent cation:proton antiporter family protein [Methanocella paludicola]BAI62740.1 putative Na(+)/H(+) antiporter [Methanocella paludicola SANAE]